MPPLPPVVLDKSQYHHEPSISVRCPPEAEGGGDATWEVPSASQEQALVDVGTDGVVLQPWSRWAILLLFLIDGCLYPDRPPRHATHAHASQLWASSGLVSSVKTVLPPPHQQRLVPRYIGQVARH